jgi:hypothetical protein
MTIRLRYLIAILAAAAPALAQPAAPRPASPLMTCAEARAWLAAEETTPGILQRLAREALEACRREADQAAGQAPSAR